MEKKTQIIFLYSFQKNEQNLHTLKIHLESKKEIEVKDRDYITTKTINNNSFLIYLYRCTIPLVKSIKIGLRSDRKITYMTDNIDLLNENIILCFNVNFHNNNRAELKFPPKHLKLDYEEELFYLNNYLSINKTNHILFEKYLNDQYDKLSGGFELSYFLLNEILNFDKDVL